MKNLWSAYHLLQFLKSLECICLLISWTSATDEYQVEEVTGRLMNLSLLIVIALVSWILTVLWLILTITKVYLYLRITPLMNTVMHIVLAVLICIPSLMIVTDHHKTSKSSMENSAAAFGLATAVLFVVDALLALLLKWTKTNSNGIV